MRRCRCLALFPTLAGTRASAALPSGRSREWPAICLLAAALIAGCTPKAPTLPSGAGLPFPDVAAAYAQASDGCRGVKTLTAALAVSGRAGRTKLRGRIDAGFAAPADLRLEGVHPFGKPVFILVARGEQATLVLPRDGRVLRGASPAAIVEALAGVPLAPADLRSALAGCGFGPIVPAEGRAYDKGWASIVAEDTTTYLRQIDGVWRMAAATRGPLTVTYQDYSGGRPSTVRIRMTPVESGVTADLTLRLSQVETNVTLDPGVFDVEVPADAAPLSLEELRRAGPLGRDAS